MLSLLVDEYDLHAKSCFGPVPVNHPELEAFSSVVSSVLERLHERFEVFFLQL